MTSPCLTCEDITWLLDSGEPLANVAARLGIAQASLIRHCHRHRLDIDRHLAADRERLAAHRMHQREGIA